MAIATLAIARETGVLVKPEPLAAEDLARLRMSAPENPMIITAALLLSRAVERSRLEALLEERLLRHARFRAKVLDPRLGGGPARWVDVAALDLRDHCTWRAIDGSASSLTRLVDSCIGEPLDPGRPLWRLTVADGLEGGAALVFRVHHVIADGAALAGVLAGLADENVGGALAAARSDPSRDAGRLLRLLGGVAGAARLAVRSPDPATALHRPLGIRKRVACSAPLSLADLAAKAHAVGATVTEILLAAVAEALHAWLGPGGPARDLTVHALVPVSLAAPSGGSSGNHYASVFVALPLGDIPPNERLRRIARSLRSARAQGALGAAAHLAGASAAAGRWLERVAVTRFSRKASVVVSSVRGPASPLHIGGALLRDAVVWAPAPGNVALSVTLMSYAGRVRVGILADERAIGDPAPIAAAVERGLGAPPDRA